MKIQNSIRTICLSFAIWFCLLIGSFSHNPIVAATLGNMETTAQETISEESISLTDRIGATAKTIQDKFEEAVSKITGDSSEVAPEEEMTDGASNQVDLEGEMTSDPTSEADFEMVEEECCKKAVE